MNTVTIVVAIIAILVGGAIGYFLRIAISLGQKGSMELDIKQKMIDAKEEAQKIIKEANEKAEEKHKELEREEKHKEEELKKNEERLNKKDDSLLKKEEELNKETEKIKTKIEEVQKIKEDVEVKRNEQQKKLEEVSGLSPEDAKARLIKQIEEKYEEDFLIRMQKLENTAGEKLERRALTCVGSTIISLMCGA